MKEMRLYQVDAFTDRVFSGNPAARLTARSIWSAEPILFMPSVADRFDSPYWPIRTIVVVRDAQGRVNGLRVHAGGIRNVLLQRLPREP